VTCSFKVHPAIRHKLGHPSPTLNRLVTPYHHSDNDSGISLADDMNPFIAHSSPVTSSCPPTGSIIPPPTTAERPRVPLLAAHIQGHQEGEYLCHRCSVRKSVRRCPFFSYQAKVYVLGIMSGLRGGSEHSRKISIRTGGFVATIADGLPTFYRVKRIVSVTLGSEKFPCSRFGLRCEPMRYVC